MGFKAMKPIESKEKSKAAKAELQSIKEEKE
jgi:hypothetical protein